MNPFESVFSMVASKNNLFTNFRKTLIIQVHCLIKLSMNELINKYWFNNGKKHSSANDTKFSNINKSFTCQFSYFFLLIFNFLYFSAQSPSPSSHHEKVFNLNR